MTTADPDAFDAPRPLALTLESFWARARELYRLLLPIRFSILTVAVLGGVLLYSDQGNDAIAALAEGNPTWSHAAVIGVQVFFAVLIALFAAQVWYWSRQLLRVHLPEQPDPADWPLTITWTPRVLALAVFGIAIVSLNNVRRMYDGVVRHPAAVLLGLMIALAIEGALFVVIVILRRRRIGTMTTVRRARDFGPVTLRILRLTAFLAFALFLGSTLAVQRVARIGTISVLVTSLGLWVAFGGLVVYLGMRARIPILTWLLVFAIAISPLADNHAVRTVPGAMPQRPDVGTAFSTWYARLARETPNEPAPRPVFIVATEGGGIRAAYWTAAVLTSLSDTVPGFTEHLFAVSGVSGGSLGAATYRSLLAEPLAHGTLRRYARETLAFDALAPTISAFTQQDFVQRFVPIPILPDRARALEQGWELGWSRVLAGGRFSNGFLSTASAGADRLPSVFLNGTVVETGQRIITSNVHIDRRFAGAADALDSIGSDVHMSTAAHNSARFPYVSPVGTMSSLHIADGGYFENSGAGTAADIVDVVRRHPDYAKGLIRPYVIFISYQGIAQPVKPARFANEIAAPISTLLDVRGAHATAAVAEVHEHMPPTAVTTFSLVQHKGERYPLGWLLAARTRDLMDKQMGPDSPENGANVRAIAAALSVVPLRDAVWAEATGNENQARAEERD